MKNRVVLIIFAWWALIGGSFGWNLANAVREREEIAFQTARAFFNQMVLTRNWNSRHGGVYVPVSETTQPNLYLKDPQRDLKIGSNLVLTKINPAYMTRQISELAQKKHKVKFHITSLNPLQPLNRPEKWEAAALEEFEKGVGEVGEIVETRKDKSFWYMAPLMTEKSCLKCHAEQGYKVGDVRGGISVKLSILPQIPLLPIGIGHLMIGIIVSFFIIMAAKKLNSAYLEIKKQARIDCLTGIPNRRYFSERHLMETMRCKREGHPLSMIICDIDDFKRYNDTYGHSPGDECISEVARLIKESLRRPGDFCARYGGEEFVVILPNTSFHGALNVGKRMRAQVERQKISHQGSSCSPYVTISVGVSCSEDGNTGTDDLIRKTDAALYRAKAKGKNRVEGIRAGK